ncbi:Nonsense-mediated mRNA decay 2 isoform 2 [Chlorella sorokiniana]|uniref:Nonsense-mediated mRNA decay 2 isoform 2 n=1 Tax=Chlorella sorokiniana TaxID=3076 RepID=A0A2P6TC34_CHLSO|nr:Nonsense-mediated mRNA decay 2 isoform 2 [Chlorella sorokiniana]|eukprot:PRW20188.1 Nonsense-mediated mRNA decay 2 isoform 2 [Chlorella sorokiniana]
MGKNQTHKSMQMAKHASRGGGGGPEDVDTRYAGHDASFHTAEWHAARLAALTMERPSWDDWKKQQDEAAAREAAMEAANAQADREYKEALEAERARRLGYTKEGGVTKKKDKKSEKKKDKKERKKRKRSSKDKKKKHKRSSKDKRSKKKKRRHSSSDSSSSGSGSSSSSDSGSSSSDQDYGGMGSPVRLSKFLSM